MRFPENALLEFVYWLINTPGLGGIVVGLLGVTILTIVSLTLRWIVKGGEADEKEEYVYPTSTLLGHD